jgi:CHAT domain
MDYLDFEIEIGPGSGADAPVAIIRSPAGEARETIRLPFDGLVLQNRLLELQNALLRSGGQHRQALAPDELQVRDFGQALFDALFAGNVRSRYDVSRERAQREDKGLRLKLAIESADLAALPWEFLYDPRQAEYLCLSLHTPLVRYFPLPRHAQPMEVTPPLRILAMIASPLGLPPLDVARERQRLQDALGDLQARGLVDLVWLTGQTWHDLQQALRGGPWHIFHFMGHGGFDRAADEGFLAMADGDFTPVPPIPARHRPSVQTPDRPG